MSNRKQYLLIIDGSSLLATSYYSTLPKALRKEKDADRQAVLFEQLLPKDPQGRYINAVEKFFKTLSTIEIYQRPTHLVICWDSGRNTFRKEMWPKYKSNRSETPPPLKEQFQTCIDLCSQLGITQVMDPRYEADDFAGSFARAMEPYMDVRILTRDKDYFQLISERTRIWYGMADLEKVRDLRKKYDIKAMPSRVVEVDRQLLLKEFGYSPESVPLIKALFGDVSDNIPGVSGMGETRSVALAQHYYDLEALYRDIDRNSTRKGRETLGRKWRGWGIMRNPYTVLVKPATGSRSSARDMARLCYVLGKIKTDIDLFEYLEDGYLPDLLRFPFDMMKADAILSQYNIQAVPKRIRIRTGANAARSAGKTSRSQKPRKTAAGKSPAGQKGRGQNAARQNQSAKAAASKQAGKTAGKADSRKAANASGRKVSRKNETKKASGNASSRNRQKQKDRQNQSVQAKSSQTQPKQTQPKQAQSKQVQSRQTQPGQTAPAMKQETAKPAQNRKNSSSRNRRPVRRRRSSQKSQSAAAPAA